MDYINAFWVGGLICALAQILLEKTKLMPGRIMVLIVCLGAVLSFFGIYEPFAEYAGAGASVPLLGFGNVLMKGVKDAVDEYGFLGIFMGGFKAGAVGCSGALILSYLASLVFHYKIKKEQVAFFPEKHPVLFVAACTSDRLQNTYSACSSRICRLYL